MSQILELIDKEFKSHKGMVVPGVVCARHNLDVEQWNSYMNRLRDDPDEYGVPLFEDIRGVRHWGYVANHKHEYMVILQRSRLEYNTTRKSFVVLREMELQNPADFNLSLRLADFDHTMKKSRAWIEFARDILFKKHGVKTYAPRALP